MHNGIRQTLLLVTLALVGPATAARRTNSLSTPPAWIARWIHHRQTHDPGRASRGFDGRVRWSSGQREHDAGSSNPISDEMVECPIPDLRVIQRDSGLQPSPSLTLRHAQDQ